MSLLLLPACDDPVVPRENEPSACDYGMPLSPVWEKGDAADVCLMKSAQCVDSIVNKCTYNPAGCLARHSYCHDLFNACLESALNP